MARGLQVADILAQYEDPAGRTRRRLHQPPAPRPRSTLKKARTCSAPVSRRDHGAGGVVPASRGKTGGVALPCRVVVARRRVNQIEVGGDAQTETGPRRSQGPVDVSEAEAVEQVIEGNGLQHLPPRSQQDAVEHRDVTRHGPVIENIHLPLRFVRRMMGDPASQMRMSAPAHSRAGRARAADDAQGIE